MNLGAVQTYAPEVVVQKPYILQRQSAARNLNRDCHYQLSFNPIRMLRPKASVCPKSRKRGLLPKVAERAVFKTSPKPAAVGVLGNASPKFSRLNRLKISARYSKCTRSVMWKDFITSRSCCQTKGVRKVFRPTVAEPGTPSDAPLIQCTSAVVTHVPASGLTIPVGDQLTHITGPVAGAVVGTSRPRVFRGAPAFPISGLSGAVCPSPFRSTPA